MRQKQRRAAQPRSSKKARLDEAHDKGLARSATRKADLDARTAGRAREQATESVAPAKKSLDDWTRAVADRDSKKAAAQNSKKEALDAANDAEVARRQIQWIQDEIKEKQAQIADYTLAIREAGLKPPHDQTLQARKIRLKEEISKLQGDVGTARTASEKATKHAQTLEGTAAKLESEWLEAEGNVVRKEAVYKQAEQTSVDKHAVLRLAKKNSAESAQDAAQKKEVHELSQAHLERSKVSKNQADEGVTQTTDKLNRTESKQVQKVSEAQAKQAEISGPVAKEIEEKKELLKQKKKRVNNLQNEDKALKEKQKGTQQEIDDVDRKKQADNQELADEKKTRRTDLDEEVQRKKELQQQQEKRSKAKEKLDDNEEKLKKVVAENEQIQENLGRGVTATIEEQQLELAKNQNRFQKLGGLVQKAFGWFVSALGWILSRPGWFLSKFIHYCSRLITWIIQKVFRRINQLLEYADPLVENFFNEFQKQLALAWITKAGSSSINPTWTRMAEPFENRGLGAAERVTLKAKMSDRQKGHDRALAEKLDRAFVGNLAQAISRAVDDALKHRAVEDVKEAESRCREFTNRLGQILHRDGQAQARSEDLWSLAAFNTSTNRDLINVIDWIGWFGAWALRAIGLASATNPVTALAFAWVWLAADTVDVISGAIKAFLSLFGDVIPKDRITALITAFPGIAYKDCFEGGESAGVRWLENADVNSLWAEVERYNWPKITG